MDEMMQAMFTLYDGLELLAPGDDAVTREALRRLQPLPERPRILDIGCGTGRSTLVLSEAWLDHETTIRDDSNRSSCKAARR